MLIQKSGNEKITIVSYDNRIHPLIGLYSTDLISDLLKSIQMNQLRVRDFIDSVDSKIIQLEDLDLADRELQLMNINTKEELNLIENGK
jgi:molybdopterin-guanine dinucleotide biosynthesis protein A